MNGKAGSGQTWWERPAKLGSGSDYRSSVTLGSHREVAHHRVCDLSVFDPVPAEALELSYAMASIGPYIEDIGGYSAELLLRLSISSAARGSLKRAIWDEIKHVELLDRLNSLLSPPSQANIQLGVNTVFETLDVARSPIEFACIHCCLEAQASDIFTLVAKSQAGNVLGEVYRVINLDEEWHVRIGLDLVRELARTNPHNTDIERLRTLAASVYASAPQAQDGTSSFLASQLAVQQDVIADFFDRRHQRFLKRLDSAIAGY